MPHERFAFISSRASHYSANRPYSLASKLASSLSVCLSIAHCYRGDKGIRTLDPLLARQVLSQLSYTPIWNIVNFLFLIWQPPAFPYRHQYSIIGRFRLNHRVRDVDGCFPKAHRHQKFVINFH